MKLVQYQGHWVPKGSEKAWQRYASRARDMQIALEHCGHFRTVIQAGGNIGAWPVWLSNHFVEVLTFEPEPTNFACLTRNLEPHHNVQPFFAALGAVEERVRLNVCESIGSHYITRDTGDTHVRRIDDLGVEYLDLIVLDVEGAEALALRGGRATLERCRPVIMLEDRGHGRKKGHGTDYQDCLDALPPKYKEVSRVRHDVVLVPEELA